MDSSALASSILTLRSSIKILESSADSLEVWLYTFVFLVVVGVVLEIAVVIWEHREGLEDFHRGTIRSPEKPNAKMLYFELFAAILVAVGVAGEFGVDIKSGGIQTKLREANGELILLLEDASSAALGIAAKSEQEAAQLRKNAEGLKKAAEDERLARVKIEEAVAWRSLSGKQISEIGISLKGFNKQIVSLWYNANDVEGSNFAADITLALQATKTWMVFPPGSVVDLAMSGPMNAPAARVQTGVLIASTADASSRSAAESLVKELTQRGFDAIRRPNSETAPNPQVWVNILPRPHGPQGEAKLRALGK